MQGPRRSTSNRIAPGTVDANVPLTRYVQPPASLNFPLGARPDLQARGLRESADIVAFTYNLMEVEGSLRGHNI